MPTWIPAAKQLLCVCDCFVDLFAFFAPVCTEFLFEMLTWVVAHADMRGDLRAQQGRCRRRVEKLAPRYNALRQYRNAAVLDKGAVLRGEYRGTRLLLVKQRDMFAWSKPGTCCSDPRLS